MVASSTLPAQASTTPLNVSSFDTATDPSYSLWTLPAAPITDTNPTGTNGACLTAGSDTSTTPIPGCGLTPPDTNGSGTLQLTTNDTYLVGSAFYDTSFPTAQGLDIKFNTYQWDDEGSTDGADGIGFALTAANPADPGPPSESGPTGGSLGYSTDSNGDDGLPHGYLGFGLDTFGNYTNTAYEGTGCASLNSNLLSDTRYPESVTVKGPGNDTDGYCMLATTAAQTLSPYWEGNNIPLENSSVVSESPLIGTSVSLDSPSEIATDTDTSYSATVSPTPDGGTVAFYEDGQAISGCEAIGVSSGTATCSEVSFSNPGDYEIDAVYSGDSSYATSYSIANQSGAGSVDQTVTGTSATSTSISLSADDETSGETAVNVVPLGDDVSYTATVSPIPTSGTVAFYDNGSAISGCGSVAIDSGSGDATCSSESFSTAGTHLVTAVYSGTGGTSASDYATSSMSDFVSWGEQSLDDPQATSRPANPVSVEIIINVGSAETPTGWSTEIPSDGWGIQTTPIDLNGTDADVGTPVELVGYLPTTNAASPGYNSELADTSDFPSSWIDPTTGIPYQLNLGWTASTGNSVEIHELNTFSAQTYNGAVPILGITNTDDDSGTVSAGSSLNFTLSPEVASGGASESATMTVVDTFPSGMTPGSASAPSDWSCSTEGQVVTCSYTPTSAVAADTSLPQITIPVTVSDSASGTLTPEAVVSSDDALPANAGDAVDVTSELTSTTLSASASPTSIDEGGTVTLSATGLPADATGTVTFMSGSTNLCASPGYATVSSGSASCNDTSGLSAGSYPVTVTYSGDSTYGGSTASTSFLVLTPTTIDASATPSSAAVGTAITLSATGLPADATGTVTFMSGSTNLCASPGYATVSSGSASCNDTSGLSAGSYPVTVTYSGDSTYGESTASTSFALTSSGLTATTLSASATPSPVTPGSTITLSASGLPDAASGTVTFTNSGTSLCSASVSSGSASCQVTASAIGTTDVDASYGGDSNYASSSATTEYVVEALTASASPSAITPGSTEQLSFGDLPSAATGTVTFTTGGGSTTLCVADLPATTCSVPGTSTQGVGTTGVTASYSGDSTYSSTSASTSFVVDALSASASPESVLTGSSSTLLATGLPNSATGTVTFTTDGSTLCSATVSNATATCTTTVDLGASDYSVTASYSGDSTYSATTAVTTLDVQSGSATSTGKSSSIHMRAVASPADTAIGNAVTLDATDMPKSWKGTVTFTSRDKLLCVATASDGSARCKTSSALPAGDYPVIATYSKSATASTSFTISAVPLTAQPVTAVISEGAVTTLTLPRPEGNGPFTYSILAAPATSDGAWTFSTDGQLRFTPAAGFTGTVVFTYDVKDAGGNVSTPATITLQVKGGSEPVTIPTAHTGEPWSSGWYWLAMFAVGLGGLVMVAKSVRVRRAR